jgi:AraC-like DNA-binding protein
MQELKSKTRVLIIIHLCCFSVLGFSQVKSDSLLKRSFGKFFSLYNKETSILKKKTYLNAWTQKMKSEKNEKGLITAYHLAAGFHKKSKETLIYCDSMIDLSLGNEKYNFSTGSAYLLKGQYYYYQKKDYKKAIDFYLQAKKYAKNKYLEFNVNYNIGTLKDRIGHFNEAIEIHRQNFYFARKNIKSKSSRTYLNSIYVLASTFNYLKKLDSARYYNKLGASESLFLKNTNRSKFFTLNQGVTNYLNGDYLLAIDSLEKASALLNKRNDNVSLAKAYYYLGESYLKARNVNRAISYFQKVDTIFINNKDLIPVTRRGYEFLIGHYKKENNLNRRLKYVEQLMKFDSILHVDEMYLNTSIFKEYDIPELIVEKENIISILTLKEKRFWKYIYVLIFTLFSSFLLLIYQYRKRRLYKNRFEEIVDRNQVTRVSITTDISKERKNNINIPEGIIQALLSSLGKFEEEQLFISPTITLQSLAKEFETNTTYLSKIVNEYKMMPFAKYINGLRIEYSIKKLQEDPVFRKYTIKAIAEEVGFNNSESFSKAFFYSKGIKPSFFVKELIKRTRDL